MSRFAPDLFTQAAALDLMADLPSEAQGAILADEALRSGFLDLKESVENTLTAVVHEVNAGRLEAHVAALDELLKRRCEAILADAKGQPEPIRDALEIGFQILSRAARITARSFTA